MQYAGISLRLEPGQKQLFTLKCASHLLNAFGQRGLTSLSYGADETTIGEEAKKRNVDFKTKQIVEYNQRNEGRKQMGMGYLPPTKEITKYAIELGLKLLEPYQVRDEERAGIAKASAETGELKEKLLAQEKEMGELKDMLKQLLQNQNAGEGAKTERPKERPGWKKETTSQKQ